MWRRVIWYSALTFEINPLPASSTLTYPDDGSSGFLLTVDTLLQDDTQGQSRRKWSLLSLR